MKYIFTLILSLLIARFAFAQAPTETTVTYNGQKYPCYVIEYNLPPDETENVIKNKLKADGYTPDKSKGFLVYRNVKLNDLDPDEAKDVFFKVERKSRKEKDKSLVTLIVAKAGEIPEGKVKDANVAASVTAPASGISFLSSFKSDINMGAYNLAVHNQAAEVVKAEDKLQDLQKEQKKLEKKIKDYQDDLAANKKSQQAQADEIAKQKEILQKKMAQKPAQ